MTSFDAAHRAVHEPPDRRFRIRLKRSVVGVVLVLAGVPVLLAWVQAAAFGLPNIRALLPYSESAANRAAWLSGVGPLPPLLQLSIPHDVDSQWLVDPDG
jgi:hypothetical protein